MEYLTTTPRQLNLGCGTALAPKDNGWVNLDFAPGPGVDVVHDMATFPWPFEDASFDYIVACHILEHLPQGYAEQDGKQVDIFYAAMNECWRLLKPGGFLDIEVPTVGGEGAFQDQTHRRYFVPSVWHYVGRPVNRIPNTEDAREGAKDGIAIGAYVAAAGVMTGKKDRAIEDQKLVVGQILAELKKNEEQAEDAVPYEWNWYHADYGIRCRFDVLVNIVDPEKSRFNYVVMRKPR